MGEFKKIDGFSCQQIGDLNGDGTGDYWCNRTTSEISNGKDIIKADFRLYFGDKYFAQSGDCSQSNKSDSPNEKYYCYSGREISFFSPSGGKFTVGQCQDVDGFVSIGDAVLAFQLVMKIDTNGNCAPSNWSQTVDIYAIYDRENSVFIRSLKVK